MKRINFLQNRGEKVLQELDSYIKDLNNKNEKLEEQLGTFNKDEEIQKLKQEISDLRMNSLIIMSEKERKAAKEFSEEHYKSCKSNIIYILEGTGIGTGIDVKCKKCETIKNITDVESW